MIPVPVIMLCKGSLIWLLNSGDHRIEVAKDVILNSKRAWCGLIPLGHPAIVTTSGLKWNLGRVIHLFYTLGVDVTLLE